MFRGRRSSRHRRRRRSGKGREPQRGAKPDRGEGARRDDQDEHGRRPAAGDDQYQRGSARHRDLAHLRRDTEPQERQPGPHLPGARGGTDWRSAQGQGELPRRGRAQHGPARHDARGGDSGAGADIGQEIRDRLRRDGEPRVPARGNGDPRLPQPTADAGRAQLPVRRGADQGALRQSRGAARNDDDSYG